MTQKNSLMEWLTQTKTINKEEDYMGLDLIDAVMDSLWLLSPRMVRRHRSMFALLCNYYHKENPIDYLGSKQIEKEFKKDHDGRDIKQWLKSMCITKGCKMFRYLKSSVTKQIEEQFSKYYQATKVIERQWFEIIDFMYDRPELINPNLIDEYIESTINRVCAIRRKNNPLEDGMRKRFGKYWKDKDGNWHPEKRRRF